MKVLIVGSGGREHALAWKIRQSPMVERVFVCPGNAGIRLEQGIECCPIVASDSKKIVEFCREMQVDLIVVGPDQALADGLVDVLEKEKFIVYGPTAKAARLESSKAFAKEIMKQVGIPTAGFEVFSEAAAARAFVDNSNWSGWVVKADGLALGKGVVVCANKENAKEVINEFLENKKLGKAGAQIIVEERLLGREVSAFHFCDGKTARFLGFACDYKQLSDGGLGPNTGGMGAYTPADWVPENLAETITDSIVQPLLQEMRKLGHPFKGTLFTGLMITEEGPKVLEFNARFGDPETQALLPRLKDDLVPWLKACAKGELQMCGDQVHHLPVSAVHVVLASQGYPGQQIRKNDPVKISDDLLKSFSSEVKVFFSGVSADARSEQLLTGGGRVLGLTALAPTRAEARALAYENLQKIAFEGAQMRRDIGE